MMQPDDPGPEERNDDPTGYYDRKMKKREEVLPFLAWIYIAVLVIIAGLIFWNVAFAQEPPVPLEEPCPSGDCTVYNQALVFAFTDDERTITWTIDQVDLSAMDLFTEITVFEFPPKAVAFPVMRAELPEIERTVGWTPNRAGTYFVKGRVCRTDIAQDGEPIEDETTPGVFYDPELRRGTLDQWILCSILIESLDPAHTNPAVYPRGFIMLIKLAPATGGVIE